MTVFLAAVIYIYTTGFLTGLTTTTQNIFFTMECDSQSNIATVTYSGGEPIDSSIITIEVNGESDSFKQFNGNIQPTDKILLRNLDSSDKIAVIFDGQEDTYSLNSCTI